MAGLFIETRLRPCLVRQKDESQIKALFHCWSPEAYVERPSPLMGGSPGGQVSNLWGVVELGDGEVIRVLPERIRFLGNKFQDYAWPEGGAESED